ncbi:Chloroperoxidase [Mycena pura]|uniref:Chloroperoxidase n=1 Tax=Mycena pura TaxID=153505 RepID=A0AAD6ULI7_9AGAR|nr:Chloroperoxidase [Mycena pura]
MLFKSIGKLSLNIYIFSWDAWLTLVNFVTPNRKVGHVVPRGVPGAGCKWPEFVAPKEGDSRCACPALNAMANHGMHSTYGKNIKFTEMGNKIQATYNFAPTFCRFVPGYAADYLRKNYHKDTFDLAEINSRPHNGIEHDASLTRQDLKYDPDQDKPYLPFIDELLDSATGKDADGNKLLTIADLSRYSSKRRSEARATNPDFTLDTRHKMFGSANSSTMLTIFGGRIADLESILRHERIPEGWEPRVIARNGLTFASFNGTVLKVERGIKETPVASEGRDSLAPLV